MKRACFRKKGQLDGLFDNVAAHEKRQMREVDQYISYQNEKLRLAVQEQRRQQTELILRNYETKVEILMKQKDGEIADALNRKIELENFLRKIETECQKWQQATKENEAMVETLNNTIERYRESTYYTNQAEDSESCCEIEAERSEGNVVQKRRETNCKCCGFRISKVILLPCKHLCCCESCEGVLGTCPICGIVKKASIEALF